MTIAEEWQELRNNFNPSQPITVNQLHIFKEQLKNGPQTQEALRILVEVYCLLRMYPEAYRLFTAIMNSDDKKIEKIRNATNLHKSTKFGGSVDATKDTRSTVYPNVHPYV